MYLRFVCAALRINGDYFPVQYYLTALYIADGMCTAPYELNI